MKRILFLLLLTVSVYGQNPSRFAKIQITGNSNSGTATKVNVQESNGEVNTQAINTGFNKNIGLNSGDVVGANTLLNQYSTTPIDWTATTFASGQVVFYSGKQWVAKTATVAGDVPAVSPKWEEITFEALANKTITVDASPTDGSNNAVSSNGVFDALATKAPISSVHNPVTLGTANGLSLATQQLSLGLASSYTTGALSNTDWNTFNNKQDALGFTPENVANKATDFSVVDNVKYPTVQAVSNQLLESNKKWVLFGDSISNTLLDPDYPFYVIDNLKLTGTVTNAVAGNTSADQLTILNSILTSTPTYFNSFDIASLLIGVNDWATNVPLGNRRSLITDANFSGRLKAIIEKILTAKPSIRLYVMTPFETNSVAAPYNSFNTAGYTLREMSVLISQICSDYSVQCIDLYSLSQLNLKTIPTLLSDGVHPNSVGAKVIGDIVAKAFLSNNNKGKLVDTGIKRKREALYEEVENNIYKIQKGSFQPSTIYDVDYKVGLGKSIPSIKLEVVSTTVDPAPVLGSGTKGFVSFLSNNILFGEYIGSSNTGDVWHQVQRNDGNTTAYNLLFNPLGGNVIIGSLANTGEKLQVSGSIKATLYTGGATLTGTPTAPTAPAGTNTTQVATTAFVQAAARPYKVYTALLSQTGTNVPTATVLENTLGGTVVWSRNGVGDYSGTLNGAFVSGKTIAFQGGSLAVPNSMVRVSSVANSIQVITNSGGSIADGILTSTSIEIRVYL